MGHKDIYAPDPGTRESVTCHSKKTSADVIKVVHPEVGKSILDYPGGANVITRVLKRRGRRMRGSE